MWVAANRMQAFFFFFFFLYAANTWPAAWQTQVHGWKTVHRIPVPHVDKWCGCGAPWQISCHAFQRARRVRAAETAFSQIKETTTKQSINPIVTFQQNYRTLFLMFSLAHQKKFLSQIMARVIFLVFGPCFVMVCMLSVTSNTNELLFLTCHLPPLTHFFFVDVFSWAFFWRENIVFFSCTCGGENCNFVNNGFARSISFEKGAHMSLVHECQVGIKKML